MILASHLQFGGCFSREPVLACCRHVVSGPRVVVFTMTLKVGSSSLQARELGDNLLFGDKHQSADCGSMHSTLNAVIKPHKDARDNKGSLISWATALNPGNYKDDARMAEATGVFVLADHLVAFETRHNSGAWLRTPTLRHGTLRLGGAQAMGHYALGAAFVNNRAIATAFRNSDQAAPPLNWRRDR